MLSRISTVLILCHLILLQVEPTINSVYYCTSCSVAVKQSNRDEHELTTQHINSVKHDELLKQLSEIYIESDNDKIDNTATPADNNIHNSQHSDSKNVLNAIETDNSNLNTNNADSELETISNAKTKKLTINQNKNCDQEIDNDSKKYITDDLNNHIENIYNTEKNDNKIIDLEVCPFQQTLYNENVKEETMEIIEVKNTEEHTQMHAPIKLLNSEIAIDESESSNADELPAKIHFCDICSIDIPYYSRKCIATHKSSNEHKKTLDKHIEFLTTYQLVVLPRKQKHRSKLWHCLVCYLEVTNPKTHVREASHISKYEKLLTTNLFIKLRHEIFLCQLCDCFVKKSEELKHITTDAKHLLTKRLPALTGNINSHQSFYLDNFNDYSSSHTSVEALNSPHTKNEVKNPIYDKNTFSELRSRFLSENDVPERNKPGSIFCTFCKVDIANNEFNIKQHVTGNTHMQNVKFKVIEAGSRVHNVPIHLDNNTSHEIQQKRNKLVKKNYVEAPSQSQQNIHTISNIKDLPYYSKSHEQHLIKKMETYTCKICQVSVPNGPYNIQIHEAGNQHKKKLQQQIEKQSFN